jgi:hypothetical protein
MFWGDEGVQVEASAGCSVNLRQRATIPDLQTVTRLPQQCTAEAILNLPAPSTKSASSLAEVPTSIWVTVGMLADKFALQLRLKRTERPKEP